MKIFEVAAIMQDEEEPIYCYLKTVDVVIGYVAITLQDFPKTKIIIKQIEMTEEELEIKRQEALDIVLVSMKHIEDVARRN